LKFTQVTLDTIAKAAGVHKMTVSLALRNQPTVSAKTRERIKALAEKMGYKPNPLLSIYQSHVRARHSLGYQATIGWINDSQDRDFWHKHPYTRGLLDPIRQQAERLGYRLDEIWLEDLDQEKPEVAIARFSKILRARGIHGIILPPWRLRGLSSLPWPDLAVIAIGSHYGPPPTGWKQAQWSNNIHHLANYDYFANMRLAMDELRKLGYRRIGFVHGRYTDEYSDLLNRGGFLAKQWDWPAKDHVPILLDENLDKTVSPTFRNWIKVHEPDAVIYTKSQALGWLKQLGLRVPQDIGLAHLALAEDVAGWSGIDAQPAEVGATAVDLTVSQLRLNERGVPTHPREVFIKGRWVSGKTTRQQLA
jgi:LacI family transcriptional regulator